MVLFFFFIYFYVKKYNFEFSPLIRQNSSHVKKTEQNSSHFIEQNSSEFLVVDRFLFHYYPEK